MKTLTELVKEYENTKYKHLFIICIYCETEELSKKFLQQAEKERFVFTNNIESTEKSPSNIFYVNMNKTIELQTIPYLIAKKLAEKSRNMVWIEYSNFQ